MEDISPEAHLNANNDSNAIVDLAWEHFRKQTDPKDIQSALLLLRRLEKTSPRLARFNIAKMKYLVGDASFQDDIRSDCNEKFGPALYLMGVHWNKKKEQGSSNEAARYLRAAAETGHLPSKLLLWRVSNVGFWQRFLTAIPAYRAAIQMIVVGARNSRDIRIWT